MIAWQRGKPKEVDNFEENGPENDHANFLSVHLTNPHSVNMAEPRTTTNQSGTAWAERFLYGSF